MMKVQTVRGPVDPEQLGYTLTHEHFSLNFDKMYSAPPDAVEEFVSRRITLENVGYVRQYPYGSRYNINFEDFDTHQAVTRDVLAYRKFGGGAIVENTSHGLGRNLKLMHEVSTEANVHVIAGTGHYIHAMQDDATLGLSVERMTDLYTKELLFGVEVDGLAEPVKCGFIGEVGSGWPISHFERNAIQATAEVQAAIGCGVSFHPGRERDAPFEIVRLYLEAGGSAAKCVMSHLDRTLFSDEDLLEFAQLGTYCQFDLFGTECSYYQLNPESYMQSDEQRIQKIMKMIGEGYAERILMAHDIHTKHRLTSFGGHGYSHILNNVLMRFSLRGVDIKTVDTMTISNPARWLEMKV
ncbi:phosphotriesterase-related protein [Anopheles nili]|uniref:phosphotriesterase-related protein n=1 Tax=Anopheles nili TaxID=185578 RepID=UPI00237C4919|nr:phosphotriesterase-related protein [Anopheles nili]